MGATATATADGSGLRTEIARVVAERDITSLYQPIVDLRTGDLVGCEVLSRGPEDSGLWDAGALFAAAADAGLLAELDLACRVLGLSRARDAVGDPGMVFVNVEPGDGCDLSMSDELLAVLGSVSFRVVVEFTERALTRRPANLLRHAHSIHERGNLVAVDDLGADPRSLALVPLLRPDICKLDISVTQGTCPDGDVTAVAAWEYAGSSGAVVLAEGIETEEHRERAVALGATWGQGFLFGHPGPITSITSRPGARRGALHPVGRERIEAGQRAVPGAAREASRLMLTLLSRQMEEQAHEKGPYAVLLASIENAAALRPALLGRYAAIAKDAALVGILSDGASSEPAPGVQGGSVPDGDDLCGDWAVTVLGPHSCAALRARWDEPLGCYRAVWSTDRSYVAGLADRLTRFLVPTVPDTSQPLPDLAPALSDLLQNQGAAAAAVGENGLFVSPPAGLAELIGVPLRGRTALDLVVADQQRQVADSWSALRELRHARMPVRTTAGNAELHLLDARPAYGVWVVVLVPDVVATGTGIATRGLLASTKAPEESASLAASAADHETFRSGWLIKDQEAFIVEADPGVTALLGYPHGALTGTRSLDLVHPDDRSTAVNSWVEMLAAPDGGCRVRLRHRRADGTYLWCEVTNHNELGDPARPCVRSELLDVDAEVNTQQELASRQRTLHTLAETLPVGVVLIDANGTIGYANRQLLGGIDTTPGTTVHDLFNAVQPADRQAAEQAYRDALCSDQPVRTTVRVPTPGREPRTYRLDINASGDGGVVACMTDITGDIRLHQKLEHQATRDSLTGCWNRAALIDAIAGAVDPVGLRPTGQVHQASAHRGSSGSHVREGGVAVLFIDLDGFKRINDEHGHAAGDATLRRCADRIQGAVRASDILGRVGGDEFVALCRGVPDRRAAQRLARHVRAALAAAEPIQASVGLAWTDHFVPVDTLVAQADADMYRVKAQRQRTAPSHLTVAR